MTAAANDPSNELPAPSDDAQRHARLVGDALRSLIGSDGGAISFERYMEAALYAPGLGYYSAGAAKFGDAGDFVTAPGISPLFSRCVARQAAQLLDVLGGGAVLEIGAGDGEMAAAIVEALAGVDSPCRSYRILERSATLRKRQQDRLLGAPGSGQIAVEWLDELPPPGFEGVVLANEVLDALAVARFELKGGQVAELCVALDDAGAFSWARRAPRVELARALDGLMDELGAGPWRDHAPAAATDPASAYVSELSLAVPGWIRELGRRLQRGALLLIDYGYPRREYYHADRSTGTLRSYYRHRAIDDPLMLPGLADITAHVDFTEVARAGIDAGLELAGFSTQADFLLACGLLDEAARARPGSPEFIELTGQIKRLTLPGEMGESTKVMALARGLRRDVDLIGFRGRDHRPRLGL